MSWTLKWAGSPTHYDPSLLATTGKPGRVAELAKDMLWEGVQQVAERDSNVWVTVSATGWENSPGLGACNLTLTVGPEPSDIQNRLREQQPVDLSSQQSSSPTVGESGGPQPGGVA